MINKFLTPEDVKQVFFQTHSEDPKGFYVEEIEIMEFSDKLLLVAEPKMRADELEQCIKFVNTLNPEVARALRDYRANVK